MVTKYITRDDLYSVEILNGSLKVYEDFDYIFEWEENLYGWHYEYDSYIGREWDVIYSQVFWADPYAYTKELNKIGNLTNLKEWEKYKYG